MDQAPQKPGQSKLWIWVVGILIPTAIVLIILKLVEVFPFANREGPVPPPPTPPATPPLPPPPPATPSAIITSGTWTLNESGPITLKGTDVDLSGTTSGNASFTMPGSDGQKFSTTGSFTGTASGTVAGSTITENIQGKMAISGQMQSGKLNFSITYTLENCSTTVSSGTSVTPSSSCDPSEAPDPHSISITISSGATASQTFTQTEDGTTLTWVEKWILNKSK
jgi:hypothetical protein